VPSGTRGSPDGVTGPADVWIKHADTTKPDDGADVNTPLDDGLFRFTPPENAKKVVALKWTDKKQ